MDATVAGWYPDPSGRNDQRYHDGATWTEHVLISGVQGVDPLPTAAAPSRPAGPQTAEPPAGASPREPTCLACGAGNLVEVALTAGRPVFAMPTAGLAARGSVTGGEVVGRWCQACGHLGLGVRP